MTICVSQQNKLLTLQMYNNNEIIIFIIIIQPTNVKWRKGEDDGKLQKSSLLYLLMGAFILSINSVMLQKTVSDDLHGHELGQE